MKLLRKSELTNVMAVFVSLLWDNMKPSNEEEVIIKATEAGLDVKKGRNIIAQVEEVKITKGENDALEGKVYCVAMKGNQIDTHGDWYSNETVKKGAEWFLNYLINLGENTPSDTNHNLQVAKGIKLTQSWVDESNPDSWYWRLVLDISEDAEAMQKAKEGRLTGVSIYGTAERIEKSNESVLKSIRDTVFTGVKDAFINIFSKSASDKVAGLSKSTQETFDREQQWNEVYASIGQIETAYYAFRDNVMTYQDGADYPVIIKSEDYQKECDEFISILKGLKFGKYQIKKGEENVENEKFIEMMKTEEGIKLLTEAGYVKKSAEPTGSGTEGNTELQKSVDTLTARVAELEGEKVTLNQQIVEKDQKITDLETKQQSSPAKLDPPAPVEETPDQVIKRKKEEERKKAMEKR